MLNEGLIHNTSATLVKSEMIRGLHRLGPTTPELWERETFKALTGHDHDELDWSIEDNHAGYYTWLRSFDQLIHELIEDGFVREENVATDQYQLVPVETDPAINWSQFVYPSSPE